MIILKKTHRGGENLSQQIRLQLEQILYQKHIEDFIEIYKHGERVCTYSTLLANLLKTDAEVIARLKIASKEHDVGKILCPPEILNKPGGLTQKERKIIQCHSQNSVVVYAERNSASKDIDIDIVRAIKHHHENFDGTGYPCGLKGAAIPFISRVIRLTDTFDALTQKRCYKKAVSCDEARSIILDTQIMYDPNILVMFIKHFHKFEKLYYDNLANQCG